MLRSLQYGLAALESLLRRRSGLDKWSVNEVIAWLGDIGMSGEGIAREASPESALVVLTQRK